MADPLELCSLRMNIPGQRKLCGGVPRQGLERLWIRTVVVDVGQEGMAQDVRRCAVQIDRLADAGPGIPELLLRPRMHAVAKEIAVFTIQGEVRKKERPRSGSTEKRG